MLLTVVACVGVLAAARYRFFPTANIGLPIPQARLESRRCVTFDVRLLAPTTIAGMVLCRRPPAPVRWWEVLLLLGDFGKSLERRVRRSDFCWVNAF